MYKERLSLIMRKKSRRVLETKRARKNQDVRLAQRACAVAHAIFWFPE